MGESWFYLKAEFPDERSAARAEKIAKAVLKELAEFHDDWQKIRKERSIPVKKRHEELLKKHPLVAELIKLPESPDDDDAMNYLAGECEMRGDFDLWREGSTIYLQCIVWHLGTWNNIADFFYKLGASWAGWLNEEWVENYFELIEIIGRVLPPLKERLPDDRLDALAVALSV